MTNTFLTDDQIARVAPSVFAADKHERRSERYVFIPTRDIVAGLRKEGFMPVWAGQSKTRDPSNIGYTRHMVRFRHVDADRRVTAGMVPEVVLKNSHNGTSQYELYAGIFRFICANGMICGDLTGEPLKVPHKRDAVERVIEGTFKVIDTAQDAVEEAAEWNTITLPRAERLEFAQFAHFARFAKKGEDGTMLVDTPIKPEQMLVARRFEDRAPTLGNTFNVLQENGIRGGLRGIGERDGRVRRVTARAINGIDQNVQFNQMLHNFAAFMARGGSVLKAA